MTEITMPTKRKDPVTGEGPDDPWERDEKRMRGNLLHLAYHGTRREALEALEKLQARYPTLRLPLVEARLGLV